MYDTLVDSILFSADVTIEYHQDLDPLTPDEWEHGCTVLHCNRDHVMNAKPIPSDGHIIPIKGWYGEDTGEWRYVERYAELVQALVAEYDLVYIAEFDYYDHSGCSVRMGRGGFSAFDAQRWDTSGYFIGITKDDAEKTGCTPEHYYEMCKSYVEAWNDYYTGKVYGFKLVNPDGEDLPSDVFDSCWGFYGDYDDKNDASGIQAAAYEAAAYAQERINAERAEVAYWAARDTLTTVR